MPDKYTVKRTLSEKFAGIIWKIETDDNAPFIGIETRELSEHRTRFSAFNYKTGECLFREIEVPDSWHWSLDRVSHGYFFLHSYVNEGSPQHAGIVAINKGGDIVWQHFNKALDYVSSQGLLIYNTKIHPKQLELVSFDTGTTLAGSTEPSPVERFIQFPEVLPSSSSLTHAIPEKTSGPILHSKIADRDILAYHLPNGDKYDQFLAIYQDKDLLLEDKLATQVPKLNPEAFFIEAGHLFCIRSSKQEIVSYLV